MYGIRLSRNARNWSAPASRNMPAAATGPTGVRHRTHAAMPAIDAAPTTSVMANFGPGSPSRRERGEPIRAWREHRRVAFGHERTVAEPGIRPRQARDARELAGHGHPGA